MHGVPREDNFVITAASEIMAIFCLATDLDDLTERLGRIVVGSPGGPGERPWGYGAPQGRNPIYKEILRTARLLDSREIARRKQIPFPFDEMIPPYPLWD